MRFGMGRSVGLMFLAAAGVGYFTRLRRRARRNPAGLAEANLPMEERRKAVSKFPWRRRRRESGHSSE